MILAKIQVRYRLNDDLFIDKGIIPCKKKKQEKRTLVHRLHKLLEYTEKLPNDYGK